MNLIEPANLNYQEIVCEDKSGYEVLDERGNYTLYCEQELFYLTIKNNAWIRELPSSKNYFTLLDDNHFLYFYQNEGLWYLQDYSSEGLYCEHLLLDNPFRLNHIVNHQGIYLVGAISNYQLPELVHIKESKNLGGEDALIIKLDQDYEIEDLKIYGGCLDEEFLKIAVSDEGLYLLGSKDPLTGGDFGNGGRLQDCLFLVRMNLDLELENFIVLNENLDVLAFDYYKDYLYLGIESGLYKFSEELEVIQKKNFNEQYQYAILASFNEMIFFREKEILAINIFDFSFDTIESKYLTNIESLRAFEKALYFKNADYYYYDLATLENFVLFDNYYPSLEIDSSIMTIFSEAQFIEENTNPSFNPMIHGFYQRSFLYKSPHQLSFQVTRDQEVEMRVNVSEGFIYPLGYELRFSGQAELNGQSIFNNHLLCEVGFHTLELFDNKNNLTRINFEVSREQIRFEEETFRFWDLEVEAGAAFEISFQTNSPDYNYLNVVINGERHNLLKTSEKLIGLNLVAPNEAGLYYYYLDYLNYQVGEKHYTYPLKKVLRINILKSTPLIGVYQIDNYQYKINLSDSDCTARYFEVVLADAKSEKAFHYSLDSHNLYFDNLLQGNNYNLSIYLVFDLGNHQVLRTELFKANLTASRNTSLGEINIIKKGKSLESFNIVFKKTASKIVSQGEVVYQQKEDNLFVNIMIAFALTAFSGLITYQLKNLKRRKLHL